MDRRDFLKHTGIAVGTAATGTLATGQPRSRVSIVLNPADPAASAAPVHWAAQELLDALFDRGMAGGRYDSIQGAGPDDFCIAAFGRALAPLAIPDGPEALAIAPANIAGRPALAIAGADSRALVYALLEIADRLRHAERDTFLREIPFTTERPANAIRSISRMFVSDVEDKPWFHDRDMWRAYLTMLATQRFNRFSLALGIGYDFLRDVTDSYFLFPYPFLLSVPGYRVRAVNLPDAERDRNLETLKFISEQTAARGLDFQLGLWMHGYQWANSASVKANYTIEGLTPGTHAAYCRDALAGLLQACPSINGVTFRIHGESGVAEGSYAFWKTVFEGVAKPGRKIEIDMHAKGIDQSMIDTALATGMPVKVSPKFWAEHMGLPYHQADIRDQEIPHGRTATGLMALSSGERSFTRYGYADLLREDRRYDVLFRIWPGTQRLLLWGNPGAAMAYSQAFGFCGSKGVEIFEPLAFKGRRGSGIAGNRTGYADAALRPHWDWEKYECTYRVWGRLLYNPQTPPDIWKRGLSSPLASASSVLPLITTAHGPSAANNTYWPEMYTNQPIVDAGRKHPYTDTPSPKVFGNVSPFDPQMFAGVNECAAGLVKRERTGKYSPIEVAQYLEDVAAAGGGQLEQVDAVAYRRQAIDAAIQMGIGRFFAAKLRAGVLYGIHQETGNRTALEEAVRQYRRARGFWAQLADRAKGVYVADVTIGEHAWLRGHWLDRLPAIDEDLGDMEKQLAAAPAAGSGDPAIGAMIAEAIGRPQRPPADASHKAPERFHAGQPLELEIAPVAKLMSVRLYYRHVNHAERYQSLGMQENAGKYRASIPADYTASPFPLAYYFEFREAAAKVWMFPGLGVDFMKTPYFVVRRG